MNTAHLGSITINECNFSVFLVFFCYLSLFMLYLIKKQISTNRLIILRPTVGMKAVKSVHIIICNSNTCLANLHILVSEFYQKSSYIAKTQNQSLDKMYPNITLYTFTHYCYVPALYRHCTLVSYWLLITIHCLLVHM